MIVGNKSKLTQITDFVISTIIATVILYFGVSGVRDNASDKVFYEAVFFISLGVLFCFAYFHSGRLLLLKIVILTSEKLSFPQKKIMALVYASMFIIYGAWRLYSWIIDAPLGR